MTLKSVTAQPVREQRWPKVANGCGAHFWSPSYWAAVRKPIRHPPTFGGLLGTGGLAHALTDRDGGRNCSFG